MSIIPWKKVVPDAKAPVYDPRGNVREQIAEAAKAKLVERRRAADVLAGFKLGLASAGIMVVIAALFVPVDVLEAPSSPGAVLVWLALTFTAASFWSHLVHRSLDKTLPPAGQ